MDKQLEAILNELQQKNEGVTVSLSEYELDQHAEAARVADIWKKNYKQDKSSKISNTSNDKIYLEQKKYTIDEFDLIISDLMLNKVSEYKTKNTPNWDKLEVYIDLSSTPSIIFNIPNPEHNEYLRLKAIYG